MVASFNSLVLVCTVAALAGCPDRRDAVVDGATVADAVGPGDATSDAPSCSSTTVFTPVTVTGTSPGGSLDGFHYAFAARGHDDERRDGQGLAPHDAPREIATWCPMRSALIGRSAYHGLSGPRVG